ncbi:universal stress protein [Halomonas sp. HNIBRBA4712]|uniref:universal stress protein n=1 Tax=Halomonas sp. HNIBRBA4712 TaxID=3373087 RepID=UPI00374539B8
MTEHVFAAIDDSCFAQSVSEYGAWASLALGAPLTLLNVIDNHATPPGEQDLSGNLSLGSQEQLMETLSRFDEQRARENRRQSKALMERAVAHVDAAGGRAQTRTLNGTFVETLLELENETRLLIVGRHGAHHESSTALGEHVETLVRRLKRPVLIVPETFAPPRRVMVAFDGSQTARRGVEMLAGSPLFHGAEYRVVSVGHDTAERRHDLDWALSTLRAGGHSAEGALIEGEVDRVLSDEIASRGVDLLAMGAYGHSRLRQLLMGSTTTKMLRGARVPVLVLR